MSLLAVLSPSETFAVIAIIAFFTLAGFYIWEDIRELSNETLAEREHEGAGIPKRAAVVVCDSPTGRAPHTAVARHSSRSVNVSTDRGREPQEGSPSIADASASPSALIGGPSRSPSLATIGADADPEPPPTASGELTRNVGAEHLGPRPASATHSRALFDGRTGGRLPDNQEGRHGGQDPYRLYDWQDETA